MFITAKRIKSFLKKYSIEELCFKFLPVDIYFCLSENEAIMEKIKIYLVFKLTFTTFIVNIFNHFLSL
jgi:hypothetical protein